MPKKKKKSFQKDKSEESQKLKDDTNKSEEDDLLKCERIFTEWQSPLREWLGPVTEWQRPMAQWQKPLLEWLVIFYFSICNRNLTTTTVCQQSSNGDICMELSAEQNRAITI